MNLLHPGSSFDLPSARLVKENCEQIFQNLQLKIKNLFLSNKSKFSCTTDLWTSPNNIAICGTTIHWIDEEGKLNNLLLDFKELEGLHTGENLAENFKYSINSLELNLNQILSISADNASNNDTFFQELNKQSDETPIQHSRCVAHIINLSVKDALTVLSYVKDSDEEIFYDNDTDFKNTKLKLSLIQKIRKIVKYVRSSPQRRKTYYNMRRAYDLDETMLLFDVRTRWNSTFYMFAKFIESKAVVDMLTATEDNLSNCKLDKNDWSNINEFMIFLKPFEQATKILSGETYPTLSITVPIYQSLLDHLHKYLLKSDLTKTLETAAKKALCKMEKYYIYFDSEMYYIAIVLDPRLKMEYYKQGNWQEKYVKMAEIAVSKEYEKRKNNLPKAVSTEEIDEVEDFGFMPILSSSEEWSELKRYLYEPVLPPRSNGINLDICTWWNSRKNEFPILFSMFRDYLAIPGTSVPIERKFNAGRDLISLRRINLKPETVRIMTLAKSWSSFF